MSIQSTSSEFTAEDVRALANVGFAHNIPMSFLEVSDLKDILAVFGKSSKNEAFASMSLKKVPQVCLDYAAHLPLISLFQQLFYSAVYDTGLDKADLQSHTCSLECQRLLGELLLNEGDLKENAVQELTHRLLNRLSPKSPEWIGAMSNFFAACKFLLKRKQLESLKKETSELVEIKSPMTDSEVLVLVANKTKLNMMTFLLAYRQLLGCFERWKCGLKDGLAILQESVEDSLKDNPQKEIIKKAHKQWCSQFFKAFEQLLRKISQPLDEVSILLLDQSSELFLNDDKKELANFVKESWGSFEKLSKKLARLERGVLGDLSVALENLLLIRYLDHYLQDQKDLGKISAEQLRFELLQAYSKQTGYPDPSSCWKKAAPLKTKFEGKKNPKAYLTASLCLGDLHQFLADLRPIAKALTAIPYQELDTFITKKKSESKPVLKPAVVPVEAVSEPIIEEEPLLSLPAEPMSYPDALLAVTRELQQSIVASSWTVSPVKRHWMQNAAMKLSFLTAELLLASQGLDEKRVVYHEATVAKYIHGILQELLTAQLPDSVTKRVHSLVSLAKMAQIETCAELFSTYNHAGAAARRPQQFEKILSQPVVAVLRGLATLLDAAPNSQLEALLDFLSKEGSQVHVKNESIQTPFLFQQKDCLLQKMALTAEPAAKQCLENAVWNLEMLEYRLTYAKTTSIAGIDLLVNECSDLFHTIAELILRAEMIQKGLYSNEEAAQQELGHSLESQIRKAGFQLDLWRDDLKQFVHEYDQVSFTRFAGKYGISQAADLAKKTRETASLQRRLMGQKGYAELTQLWEELDWEVHYNSQLLDRDGFTVKASRTSKKALQIYHEALAKVLRDTTLLQQFMTNFIS